MDRVGHVLHYTSGSVPHLPLTHLAGGGDQEVSDLSHNVTRCDESKEARVLERPVRHGQRRNWIYWTDTQDKDIADSMLWNTRDATLKILGN